MNSILPSIMQSIKPQYCEFIAVGRKGYEVRKTGPKLDTPFKVYIYCTRDKGILFYRSRHTNDFIVYKPKFYKDTEILLLQNGHTVFNGKVIGEYICDEIQEWVFDNEYTRSYDISDDDLALTCLTQEQLWEYGKGKTLYGYHITNLKIYDEPKELSEFYTICNKDDLDQCGDCKYIESCGASFPCEDGGDWWCSVDNKKPFTLPFQSWGYVYEID